MDPQAVAKFCYDCGKPLVAGVCTTCLIKPAGAAPGGASVSYPQASAPSWPDSAGGQTFGMAGGQTSAPARSRTAGTDDWRKFAGAGAAVLALLWKYKFTIYIALRSLAILNRHR